MTKYQFHRHATDITLVGRAGGKVPLLCVDSRSLEGISDASCDICVCGPFFNMKVALLCERVLNEHRIS